MKSSDLLLLGGAALFLMKDQPAVKNIFDGLKAQITSIIPGGPGIAALTSPDTAGFVQGTIQTAADVAGSLSQTALATALFTRDLPIIIQTPIDYANLTPNPGPNEGLASIGDVAAYYAALAKAQLAGQTYHADTGKWS